MRIRVDRRKCSGCHLCEMVCSLFHLGVINTEKSAVRIRKGDLDASVHSPVLCRQCKDMRCLEGEKTSGQAEKRKFLWIGARAGRCPFHALPLFGNEAYHCDLCRGSPRCVKVCTPGALRLST